MEDKRENKKEDERENEKEDERENGRQNGKEDERENGRQNGKEDGRKNGRQNGKEDERENEKEKENEKDYKRDNGRNDGGDNGRDERKCERTCEDKGIDHRREEQIRILFSEDEWRCLRVLHERPEDVRAAAEYVAERTHKKARSVRDTVFKEMVQRGILELRTFAFTEAGEREFERHKRWWTAMLWSVRGWNLEKEKMWELADRLLCNTTADFIAHTVARMEQERMREGGEVGSELIGETDFVGVIPPGCYRVDFCLLETAKQGKMSENEPFSDISELNRCFRAEGKLYIEPLRSRLELIWEEMQPRLLQISYWMDGEEHVESAVDGKVPVYLKALIFEQVAGYRILDGECMMTLYLDNGEERYVRLELPLSYE